jgi:hypothetical protein
MVRGERDQGGIGGEEGIVLSEGVLSKGLRGRIGWCDDGMLSL